MIFYRFFYPPLSICSYLIGDEKTKTVAVIDPIRHVEDILNILQEGHFTLTDIIETHAHADFISGSVELKQRLKGKPVIHSSVMGGKEWQPVYADHGVKEKDEIKLGNIRLQAIHTPGHSPEHLIWVVYDDETNMEIPCYVFTGDLLFTGGVGRPDILGEENFVPHAHLLYRSLFEKMADLPDHLIIFPGHGKGSSCGNAVSSRPFSSLGYERKTNKNLFSQSFEAWKKNLQLYMPKISPSFARIKQMNLIGAPILERQKIQEFFDIPVELNQLFLMDIRNKEAFSKGHKKDSINVPWGDSFAHWISWVVPHHQQVLLIYDLQKDLHKAVQALQLVGFDNIAGYLKYIPSLSDIALPLLPPDWILNQINSEPSLTILDVRTHQEWDEGHIFGALHVELDNLENEYNRLPKENSIAVICRSGYRASIAASMLKKAGFSRVCNIQGGMKAWSDAGYPIVTENLGG